MGCGYENKGDPADDKSPDLDRGMDVAFNETGNMGAWES